VAPIHGSNGLQIGIQGPTFRQGQAGDASLFQIGRMGFPNPFRVHAQQRQKFRNVGLPTRRRCLHPLLQTLLTHVDGHVRQDLHQSSLVFDVVFGLPRLLYFHLFLEVFVRQFQGAHVLFHLLFQYKIVLSQLGLSLGIRMGRLGIPNGLHLSGNLGHLVFGLLVGNVLGNGDTRLVQLLFQSLLTGLGLLQILQEFLDLFGIFLWDAAACIMLLGVGGKHHASLESLNGQCATGHGTHDGNDSFCIIIIVVVMYLVAAGFHHGHHILMRQGGTVVSRRGMHEGGRFSFWLIEEIVGGGGCGESC
jgi:hypothetical protein